MNSMSFGELKADVQTTNNRGATPEEVAHRCVGKIVAFSEDANPALRDQAMAYRASIAKLLVIYMKQAIQSDCTTVYQAIKEAGHPMLADYIRTM